MKYEMLIFDLDDTLFDYKATERDALQRACVYFGLLSNEAMYEIFKQANSKAKKMVPNYLTNFNEFRNARATIFLDSIHATNCSPKDFVEKFLEFSTIGILMDGVSSTLERLADVKKIVATNGSTYPRKNKLDNSTIAKHFCAFYSSEDIGFNKPSPKFFDRILSEHPTQKSKVLVIGDNAEIDGRGALSAGLNCCIVNGSQEVQKVALNLGLYCVPTFSGIWAICDGRLTQ